MPEQTFAAALLQQLAAWGVKYIFGVTGDDLLPFLDTLAHEEGIRYIGAANENGAAFMASYQAKLSGELGVCISSAAGAVHLLSGLADAFMDGAPVLAITGQVATAKIGTRAKQYFDQQRLMQNFAAFSELVVQAPAGLRLLIRAMSLALHQKTVTHLSIPEDLWAAPVNVIPGPQPALLKAKKRGYFIGEQNLVTNLMRQSRRPLLLIGQIEQAALVEVTHLIERWQPAVIVAQEAKGTIADSLPEVLGGMGQGWVPPLIREADCILLLGDAAYEEVFLPKVPVIQLETDVSRVNDLYLWNSLAGDLVHILKILIGALQDYKPDHGWMEQRQAAKKQWNGLIAADRNDQRQPLSPARFMADLMPLVATDAIITLDIGAFIHWFDRNFQAGNQRILLSSRWRSMGSALPAAIGVKLLYPDKQVLALVGDGGFLMSLGELVTAVKYKLPVVVLIINNQLYGLEKDKTIARNLTPLGLEIPAVDFHLYAQACGALGLKLEDPADLEDVFSQALAATGPAVINVNCRDQRLPYPTPEISQ